MAPMPTRLLLLAGLLGSQALPATEVQSLDALRETVGRYLLESLGGASGTVKIDVGQLDQRLRLPRCPTDLQLSRPPGSPSRGATSVAVRCAGSAPWSLYVPATIRREFVVLVTKQNLDRGRTLTDADFQVEKRLLTDAPAGALSDPASVNGQIILRALPAGAVLTSSIVKAGVAVKRGQAVTLSLSSGPVAIEVAGVAMQNGAIGDRVSVRNTNSRRIVEGVVKASNVVAVD